MGGRRAAALMVAVLAALAALATAAPAFAGDIVHVVHQGQNLGMIARRYHTTVEAIRRRNRLERNQMLHPGQKLFVEEVEAHARWRRHLEKQAKAAETPNERASAKGTTTRKGKPAGPPAKGDAAPPKKEPPKKEPPKKEPPSEPPNPYARRGAKPGYVIVVRRSEVVRGQLVDERGRLVDRTVKRLDRLLRSRRTGAVRAIDRRLLKLLAEVSDHFGGRSVIVVSGYRPYSERQYTRNSRHNHGAAIDFRIAGVPEADVFAFCRTLRGVGCGRYPTSGFLHLDVRRHKTEWIDYSGPGEPPRYARRVVQPADEPTKGRRPRRN